VGYVRSAKMQSLVRNKKMFQTRHYNKIASVLRKAPNDETTDVIIRSLAKIFREDNDNFNEDRFLDACAIK
jgi:uncharacterized membrane protein YqiK